MNKLTLNSYRLLGCSGLRVYRWDFEKKGKVIELSVEGPLTSNDQELVIDAAMNGLGIVYTYDARIYRWIEEGRLERVLADWSPTFPGLFLYYPNRRPRPALRALIDCLREESERGN